MLSVLPILVFFVAFMMRNFDTATNVEERRGSFRGTINRKLIKYNAYSKNHSAVSEYNESNALLPKYPREILQVNDMIYVFGYALDNEARIS